MSAREWGNPPLPRVLRFSLDMIRALLLAASLLACPIAAAQMRTIPGDAKRAEIRHLQDTVVELDGARARLAPGVQIRDADNRLIVPTAILPGAPAKYMLDANGAVLRIWLLSPAEAVRKGNWN